MKRYLIAGLAIILVTNAFILGHVAINRSGEPVSTLILSEKEANMIHRGMFDGENSANTVNLSFRVVSPENTYYNRSIDITREETISLGFNFDELSESNRTETRNLFWVLELNGTKYLEQLGYAQEEVKALQEKDAAASEIEYAEALVKRIKNEFSRLYVLDVGTDADALYEKYENRDNVVVVEGETRLVFSREYKEYVLFFQKVLIRQIMVPPEYRTTINQHYDSLNYDENIKFNVTISWGQLNEPWLVSLALNSDG